MKLKRLAALVLAGAMCLTTFVGCGVKPDETAATLGDQKVSAGLVNFYCKYEKASYDDAYSAYFGADFWEKDLFGYGMSMEEYVKQSAMNFLHELYVAKAHMAEKKVELTADETAAIKKAAQAFIAANSEEALEEMGATEEIVIEMLTLRTIQQKVYEAIVVDADHNVTEEDANMRGITLVEINIEGKYNDKGTYVKYTDAEVKSIKLKANKILTESAGVGLEKAAKNNGYTAQDTAYNKKDTTMDKTLLEALNALKVGETSKVIETSKVLYIATIDEDVDKKATEENKESIIADREFKLYEKVMKEWMKDDGWKVNESVVDKIEFHHKLTQKDPSKPSTEKDTQKTESTEKGTENK